jgi:multidrug efflux pump subunit AcrB
MIRWAASRPAVVWAFAAGLLIAGGVAFTKLPLATKTSVEVPRLSVGASWNGASPELVEMYLTSPIEAAIQGVRGVRRTKSLSNEGSANITVELDPDTDVALARLGILERLETLREDLPQNARGSLRVGNWVPEELTEQPLLLLNVVGSYTPGALKKIAEDYVVPYLGSLPGISSVSINGGARNGVVISYNAERMQQLGLDPALITQAVSAAKISQPLGEITTGPSVLSVSVRDQPKAIEDLARLPIRGPGGIVYTLGELAFIAPEEDSEGRAFRLNGRTAVGISLQREAGADAIKTAAAARTVIRELQPKLPPGVRIAIARDESEDLAKQLNDLMLRGAIAFGAVFVVLLATMRSLPGATLVLGSAAVAIAGTALGLYLFKIPANMLTLAGLAMGIGILVQNGLVVVERLRHVANTADARATAGRAIAPAVVGSTLTTAVVLFPFLYLQGNTRAAFVPFAAAFLMALFWSVGTALVLVPAVGQGGNRRLHGWPRLSRVYERVVNRLLRWRWVTVGVTVATIGVLTWGFITKVPRNSWGGWGGGERSTIQAGVSFPRGSDPAQIERLVRELESVAVGRDGVALVTANVSPSGGQVVVEFTPEGSLGDAPYVVYEELVQRSVLIGGTNSVNVSPPKGAQGYYNSSGGGMGPSRRIRILGYSYDGVLQVALDLKRRLSGIARVRKDEINVNAGMGWNREKSVSIAMQPDRAALDRIGASAQDFAGSVARQVRGATGATSLEIGDETVDVAVRSIGTQERTMVQLGEGLVSNTNRSPVRISDVSTVAEVEGLSTIQREDQQYIRVLSYDFRGPQKLADRTHKAFMESISVPAGYVVEDEVGTWGEDESAKGLWYVFAIGVALVLLAVALVFDSTWAAVMVFLSLPIALGGVVAAFWVTKSAFTREAAVGVILVVGLAVNQSILLIDAVLQARRRHGETPANGADVMRAALDRAGMIILVTLTTLASLIPMAWGSAATTLFGAIALATAGGTVAGTVGAMFLMPAFLMGWRGQRRKSSRGRQAAEIPAA